MSGRDGGRDGDELVVVEGVSKAFRVPAVRRETVREHVLDLFRRRPSRSLEVLADVSFAVRRGESLGIMGRNGTGKSTLLKILAGIYQADRGRVEVRAPLTPILELGVGWNPELDAIDNVELLGVVLGMTLAEVRAATAGILDFAGVRELARLPLKHFSSGMAVRLAYAVAFRAVKEVLLLDEVFAVGDVGFKQRCYQRYRELRAAGHTLLLVSHNPGDVAEHCSRALLLDGGRVVLDASGEEVAAAYEQRMLSEPTAVRGPDRSAPGNP